VGIADVIDFLPFGIGQDMFGNQQLDTVDVNRLFFFV